MSTTEYMNSLITHLYDIGVMNSETMIAIMDHDDQYTRPNKYGDYTQSLINYLYKKGITDDKVILPIIKYEDSYIAKMITVFI